MSDDPLARFAHEGDHVKEGDSDGEEDYEKHTFGSRRQQKGLSNDGRRRIKSKYYKESDVDAI